MPLISDELPDPLSDEDKLFRRGEPHLGSTEFSDDPSHRDFHIWEGFFKAGGHLIHEACSAERYDLEALSYPALYCYRHGLEMAMKCIIGEYGPHAGVAEPNHSHSLKGLWSQCKEIIAVIHPPGKEFKSMANIEKCLDELHVIDPKGEAFRYSTTKNKAKQIELIGLPDYPVDLSNLFAVMDRLNREFGGMYDLLSEVIADLEWREGEFV